MQPQALTEYLGKQSAWAVPLAVLARSPAYLDGLPRCRLCGVLWITGGAAVASLAIGWSYDWIT
jgi:hypothetical protein